MPFSIPTPVPYYQVDQQGVVFNMWYLGWFDEAMTAYLASIGYRWDVMVRDGFDVQLVHTEIDWSEGVRFGDNVAVEVSTERVGTTSFTLAFRVVRGDAVPITARTTYVVIATDGSGKHGVPPGLRDALIG
jgi:acyl-CoA thioester hydrolase